MLSACALKKAVKKGTLLGIQVMQVTYIPKDYLCTYVKVRLENIRIPLCRLQIDFIDRLTEEAEDANAMSKKKA